jgi:hypothetical protein
VDSIEGAMIGLEYDYETNNVQKRGRRPMRTMNEDDTDV